MNSLLPSLGIYLCGARLLFGVSSFTFILKQDLWSQEQLPVGADRGLAPGSTSWLLSLPPSLQQPRVWVVGIQQLFCRVLHHWLCLDILPEEQRRLQEGQVQRLAQQGEAEMQWHKCMLQAGCFVKWRRVLGAEVQKCLCQLLASVDSFCFLALAFQCCLLCLFLLYGVLFKCFICSAAFQWCFPTLVAIIHQIPACLISKATWWPFEPGSA